MRFVPANFSFSCMRHLGARERDGKKNSGEVSNLTVRMVDDFDSSRIKRATVSVTADD